METLPARLGGVVAADTGQRDQSERIARSAAEESALARNGAAEVSRVSQLPERQRPLAAVLLITR